ncbi:MAG: recombinase family protein [Candidatus Electronema sp. V4]|uniref:recombinase family protein n=1 Tax=Candidatus Electronema sp. V4 TaxID=3454756 RepID=UPI0040555C1A
MKAYAYLRVSGQGQVDGNGFERQQAAVNQFAQKANIEITQFFKEEVSGTADSTEREVFQQMISAILRNGVRTIIVEGLDRLAREYRIQEQLLIYLAAKGIALYDARTGENVTEAIAADPMKKALIQMQGIFSELEKNLLVKKLRVARQSKKEETGKCEGRKGYQDNTEKMDFLLKEIKSYRRKSKGGDRKTYQEVADYFNQLTVNDNRYSSFSGKEWNGPMIQNFLQKHGK